MKRNLAALCNQAQQLFFSGVTTNAEIAAHLHVKPHTVGRWRRHNGWDEIKRKTRVLLLEEQAKAEVTTTIQTNRTHMKAWDFLLAELIKTLAHPDPVKVRMLQRQASVLERAQKGQRLGRGMNLDGQTEERLRAETNAVIFKLIDVFVEAVKEFVADEETRDRIGQRILGAIPHQAGVGAQDQDEPGSQRSSG